MERELHCPVLLPATLLALQPERGGLFIDCTLGLGGHSEALLDSNPEIFLIGIDRDREALERATVRLARFGKRFWGVNSDFRHLPELLPDLLSASNFANQPIRGILADLGVSSMQFDLAERGFSFQHEGPLDMRMDRQQFETAAELINGLPEKELADLIYQFGEEPASRAIARQIVKARAVKPLRTTTELADLISRTIRGRGDRANRIHPATRTFQALRIAVNRELEGLAEFVSNAIKILASGGRLVIISFHSLEDRLIKNSFRFEAGECRCPRQLPVCQCGRIENIRIITKKPIIADETEILANPRSRSAKLRVCEKL